MGATLDSNFTQASSSNYSNSLLRTAPAVWIPKPAKSGKNTKRDTQDLFAYKERDDFGILKIAFFEELDVFEEIPICFPSFNLSFNQNWNKKNLRNPGSTGTLAHCRLPSTALMAADLKREDPWWSQGHRISQQRSGRLFFFLMISLRSGSWSPTGYTPRSLSVWWGETGLFRGISRDSTGENCIQAWVASDVYNVYK